MQRLCCGTCVFNTFDHKDKDYYCNNEHSEYYTNYMPYNGGGDCDLWVDRE